MPSKAGYTINMVNEGSDPQKLCTAGSTKAHYRRVKKFCTSDSPAPPHYERCGYNAGFTPDADGMYSFGFIGAPEDGTFKDFYDACNMCMAEDRSEEFVVQFLRENARIYVNMAVTFVKGLSEKDDGSVVFDGGKHARDYADGILYNSLDGDERFEIGMKVDFTWGFDYLGLDPKVVKCKGLCFDMAGFQMEIVGNFDASKNQHWDDKSRDFFKQTFNFRLDDSSEECYIRFARDHEEANNLGDYTIVTRDFRQRFDSIDGSNGIDLDFTVRHRSKPEPHSSMEAAPQQESVSKSLMESPEEEDPHPPQQALPEPSVGKDCDPSQQEPREKVVRFFDHPEHKLQLAPENYYEEYGASCDACMESLQRAKWLYKCPNNGNGCDYAVHATCAQFPRTFQHPSHPKHAVKLRKLSPGNYKQCDPCKEYIMHGLHYHCAMCDFDAHPVCPGGQDCDPPQQASLEGLVGEADSNPSEQASKEAPEEEVEWDPSQHLGMTPEQYLAYQMQLLQQQTQLQAFQLQTARQSAAFMVNSGRALCNLAGGPKTCYRNCWSGCCTC